ncbi:MAG: hypothetical protein WCL18_00695 [bacterium]
MKTLLILLGLMVSFTANTLFAQDTNKPFLQKVKVGFVLDPQVNVALDKSTPIDFTSMPVNLALFTNINFITKHTYHNLCYAWGGNAVILVSGWVYNKKQNQDIYLVLSKNFSKPGGNILIAWEHELTSGLITTYGAIEVGTPWNTCDKLLVNLCLTIPVNIQIWGKK